MFPVIFLLAVLVFFLSEITPGDKVEDYLDLNGSTTRPDEQLDKQDYMDVAKSLNLDLPAFYFNISPRAYPDTLYKLNIYPTGKLRKSLFEEYLSMSEIDSLFLHIDNLVKSLENSPDSIIKLPSYSTIKNEVLSLLSSENAGMFKQRIGDFEKQNNEIIKLPADIQVQYKKIIEVFDKLKANKISMSGLIPKFTYFGANNRFHRWFGKILKLDFGISIVDGQKVLSKISGSLRWTLLYIFFAYILTFAISIPLGIYTAINAKKKISKFLNLMFATFYSMPLFWLATLAVILFTTSEITRIFNIFPSIGIGDIDSDMSTMQQLRIAAPHLILPALVTALHSGAYLGTLIRRNMLVEMKKKYFLSLLSRGISKKQVILKHIFPNSIQPFITLLVVSLPASLAGSVITEVIFNIPGMGRLLYDSILHNDWNIVFAIVLIIGFSTYLAYMLGDMLYNYFNPKIRFGNE